MNEEQKKMLNEALNILYLLEDATGYDNKNIGDAVDLLQKELNN